MEKFCYKCNEFYSTDECWICWKEKAVVMYEKCSNKKRGQYLCDKLDCYYCYNLSFASFHDKWKMEIIDNENKFLYEGYKINFFNFIKNGKSPRFVSKGTDTKYLFTCYICNHNFNSNICNITGNSKKWCKFCSNQVLCDNLNCDFCFNKSFDSYEDKEKIKCWNLTLNKGITPRQVFRSTSYKFWFTCYKCKHDFDISLNNVTGPRKNWCRFCSDPPKELCNNLNCDFCFNKSFDSYEDKEKIKCWNLTLNKGITPRQVFRSTSYKFWFTCYKCKHDFDISLNNVTGPRKNWCRFCSDPPKELCNNLNCDFCFNKSFDSYEDKEKVKCWNLTLNKGITPRQVFKFTNYKFWFTCYKCNHDFYISLGHVCANRGGRWCPFCSNKKLCDNLNCDYCFNNSFDSFEDKEKVKCWNLILNKGITPRQVFKSSNFKFWFTCYKCKHDFDIPLSCVVCNREIWCRFCSDPPKELCNNLNCYFCFNKSFDS